MHTMTIEPGEWPRLELNLPVSVEQQLAHMRHALTLGLPEVRPCKPHQHRLDVAAGGPSLVETKGDLTGYVAAVNGSLRYLLEQGIVPHACGVADPQEHMAEVVVADRRVRYYVASTCHPQVFARLRDCHVTLWHPSGLPGAEELLREAQPETWFMLGGGSTMGLRWINLGYALGFRSMALHGFDSSFRGEATHAYPDRTDGHRGLIVNGYATRLGFVQQVSDFMAIMHRFQQPDIEPVTIAVRGTGLLQDAWRRLQGETRADAERLKYEAMWRHADYRAASPCERLVDDILDALQPDAGSSIIDFGCGTGRTAAALADRGFNVVGVDIAENCLDEDLRHRVPVHVATLWDLPWYVRGHYGVCCDVMEHIPPEHVGDVVFHIATAIERACYFHIASHPDAFGRAIGQPLHLTIQPPQWWQEQLALHFEHVTHLGDGRFIAAHGETHVQ